MRWFRPDGTVKVTVNVTQEIIDRSIGRDSHNCMLYNALLPLCPDLDYVGINRLRIRGMDEFVHLPWLVSNRVYRHFLGIRVRPFKFKLRLPKECIRAQG